MLAPQTLTGGEHALALATGHLLMFAVLKVQHRDDTGLGAKRWIEASISLYNSISVTSEEFVVITWCLVFGGVDAEVLVYPLDKGIKATSAPENAMSILLGSYLKLYRGKITLEGL